MERRNDLTDGYCLATPDGEHYVFYSEQARSVRLDLSGAPAPLPAVAVDTTAPYGELALGALPTRAQTWNAPHESDWALAVGHFPFRGNQTR